MVQNLKSKLQILMEIDFSAIVSSFYNFVQYATSRKENVRIIFFFMEGIKELFTSCTTASVGGQTIRFDRFKVFSIEILLVVSSFLRGREEQNGGHSLSPVSFTQQALPHKSTTIHQL